MFKSILVPIDLADTDLAKPAIATAATLSQTWNGAKPSWSPGTATCGSPAC